VHLHALPIQNSSPRVAISILNWNGWQDTLECLQSVRQLDYPNYLIVVVDNGSTNDSAERIKGWASEHLGPGHALVEYLEETAIRGGDDPAEAALENAPSANRLVLVRNKDNLGFTGGNNVAIQYALRRKIPTDYVFLLNNDTWLEPDCVEQLVAVHRQTGAGIVGAVVLDGTDHQVDFAGRTTLVRNFFSPYVNWHLPPPANGEDSWTSETVFGTALMISTPALEAVRKLTGEYMDSAIYLYGDETSLCSNALRAGYETRVARRAVVYHRNGKSSAGGPNPLASYYCHRNLIRMAGEFLPLHWWILFQLVQLPTCTARAAKRLLSGRPRVAWAIVLGLIDGYQGVGGKWKHHDQEAQRLRARTSNPLPPTGS